MAYEVVNATDLPQETSTTLDGTEQLIGFDTAQGKRITVDELAEYILQRKISSLAGSNQTLAAALSELNSKRFSTIDKNVTTTSSGAVAIPSVVSDGAFIGACSTDGQVVMIFRRDTSFLTIKDGNTLAPFASKEIAIRIWYIPA